MTSFDNRGKAFENKFMLDEKMGFDVEARTCKIFGLWAAEKLGLSGEDAKTYAMSVVEANLEEPGFDDVVRKVKPDFAAKSLEISDEEILDQLKIALDQAKVELSS